MNHAVRLALKATGVVTVSKVVAIALKAVAHLRLALKVALKVVLKAVAISVPKVVSNPVVISAVNSAALHLAVAKAASSPVAINALTIVVATASKHATIATIATAVHPALQALQAASTMLAAAQATALRLVAPKSSVQAISSLTMRAVKQPLSALAPKC